MSPTPDTNPTTKGHGKKILDGLGEAVEYAKAENQTTPAPVFLVIERPYDSYRIRGAYPSLEAAKAALEGHHCEFGCGIYRVDVHSEWKGYGYDDGWAEDDLS